MGDYTQLIPRKEHNARTPQPTVYDEGIPESFGSVFGAQPPTSCDPVAPYLAGKMAIQTIS